MNRRSVRIKKIAVIAVLIAMGMILFIVESLLPPLPFNAKIGLANIVTLLAIIMLGYIEAGVVVTVRCVLSGLFSGRVISFVYSFFGGLAAYLIMALMYQFMFNRISVIGISVVGAFVHVFTQIAICIIMINQINVITLLPYMTLISMTAGAVVGTVVHFIIRLTPLKVLTSYLPDKKHRSQPTK